MNYPALVSLAICSLASVTLTAALPYLTFDLLTADRVKVPWWTLLAAFVLLAVASFGLRNWSPSGIEFGRTLYFSAVLIGGVFVKWLLELLAQQKFSVHAPALAQALLLAPLTLLATQPPTNSSHVLYWFFCGFFWCAVLCDAGRIYRKEAPVVRRVEP